MEINWKHKENARKMLARLKMCIKTRKCSTRLKMTDETQNLGDIELRTIKHQEKWFWLFELK